MGGHQHGGLLLRRGRGKDKTSINYRMWAKNGQPADAPGVVVGQRLSSLWAPLKGCGSAAAAVVWYCGSGEPAAELESSCFKVVELPLTVVQGCTA